MNEEKIEEMKSTLGIKSIMTQKEFCDHIEDDDLFEKYPDPILVNGDNGEKAVLISWKRVKKHLRLLEKMRRMSRPGYDPNKEITLKVSMDEDIYNQLEIICSMSNYTVEGALEEFLYWSVNNQEDFRRWIEKCKEDGTFDECLKNPLISAEWE